MLTPLQQTSGTMPSTLLRSMIDQAEERRIEEERKASGKRESEDVSQKARPEEASGSSEARANAKIHAFFFGTQKQDADPRAKLIQRFADALGVSQEAEESNFSFARRLKDALDLVARFDKSGMFGQPAEITFSSFSTTDKDVAAFLSGTLPEGTEVSAGTKQAAKYASKLGLDPQNETFSEDFSKAIGTLRGTLPTSVASLEESIGLKDLGISAYEMIDAIASPWSEAGIRLQKALDAQTEDKRATNFDVLKVLQRLEEVADPKDLEELKAERNGKGSGRVEDEETKAEREETISQLEAGEKLDDVIELQDAISKNLETGAVKQETDGEISTDANIELIQVLAAGVTTKTPEQDQADTEVETENLAQEAGQSDEAEDVSTVQKLQANSEDKVFPVRIDENGIYELLYDKAA